MTITKDEIEELRQLCPSIYTPSDASFKDKAAPWSVQDDRQPQIAIEPSSVECMQAVIKYLYSHKSIDFAIRNTGTGGASARDVVVSTHGFKGVHFSPDDDTVLCGAGLDWGELYEELAKQTNGEYACVGARCSWVGVTGGNLVGGLSWLSHEYGMGSDPKNWLDAEVVLGAGRCVWAKEEEPELMWALRGAGGNFGVITRLRLQAYKVPKDIFAGIITVPYESLHDVSRELSAWNKRKPNPKMAMLVANQGPASGFPDPGPKPGLALIAIDFHGEAHARSDDGFAWCWRVVAAEMDWVGIIKLQDSFKSLQSLGISMWGAAPLISDIDDETLVRFWKWYEESYELLPALGKGSTVLFEFAQPGAFDSTLGPEATAQPRGQGQRHVLQTVLGCPSDARAGDGREAVDVAMDRLKRVGPEVGGDAYKGEEFAAYVNEFNDLSKVYGRNLEKLKALKKRYDPDDRFNKAVDLFERHRGSERGV